MKSLYIIILAVLLVVVGVTTTVDGYRSRAKLAVLTRQSDSLQLALDTANHWISRQTAVRDSQRLVTEATKRTAIHAQIGYRALRDSLRAIGALPQPEAVERDSSPALVALTSCDSALTLTERARNEAEGLHLEDERLIDAHVAKEDILTGQVTNMSQQRDLWKARVPRFGLRTGLLIGVLGGLIVVKLAR